MRGFAPLVVLLVAASWVASAAAVPATVAGWPRSAPAGPLLPGPSGGVVVVAQDGFTYTVAAYRRDGRRLWVNRRAADCGNCDDGPQPVALQPDRTYGPIGPDGDDVWAITARGRRVAGCSGVVLADSTCIVGRDVLDPASLAGPWPAIVAVGTSTPWRVADRRYRWQDEFNVPPVTVRDGAGVAYAAFRGPRDIATGATLPGLLMAVDPTTQAILWTRIGPTQALAGLPSGVLVVEGGRTVALAGDGRARWSRPFATEPGRVVVDPRRGRVYVGSAFRSAPVVRALSLATGATAWRTRAGERARLMSVGRGGRVYVGIDAAGRRAARGLRLATGARAWQHRTSRPVLGVRELANGTVAVAAGNEFAGSSGGRLTIIDPR